MNTEPQGTTAAAPIGQEGALRRLRSLALGRFQLQLAILAMLLLLWVIFIIGNPQAFTSFNIYTSFMSAMPFFGIIAISATFVVTLGEMDLSFPSIVGIASWAFGTVFVLTGSFPLGLLVCVVVGMIAGLLNGLLVVKVGIPSLVATIGTLFFWRGLVNVLSQGNGIGLAALQESALYSVFVGRLPGGIPAQFVWFVGIALVLAAVYRLHRFGAHVHLVGDNPASAGMLGVPVQRVKILCFVQLGFFAALASIFMASEMNYFWPTQGEGLLLTTLASVLVGGTSVFGGRGTMLGTFIGVLMIGSLESGIVAIGLSGFWVQFIYGLLILAAVTLYALLMPKRA